MKENELRIAKISQMLNAAIRSKSSDDYNKALSALQGTETKPTLRQVLDAQVAAKKLQESEAKLKEDNEDRKRLEKARQSMESEERRTKNKRTAIRQQLQQSWDEDITLKELQKEMESLKYQGIADPEEGVKEEDEEMNDEEEKRIQEVIKRYEKMFGRIKGLDSKKSYAGSVAGKSIVSSHNQSKRSKVSEFSTISQKEAYEKLMKLDQEEEKIKNEKEELMKFLEMRSQSSRTASRPTTVASLMPSRRGGDSVEKKPNLNAIKEEEYTPKEYKQNKQNHVKKPLQSNEIDDLFKNL